MGKFVNRLAVTGAAILTLSGCRPKEETAPANHTSQYVDKSTKREFSQQSLRDSLVMTESAKTYTMHADKANRAFVGYECKEYKGCKIYQLQAKDYPESVFIVTNPESPTKQQVISFTVDGLSEEQITAKYQRIIANYEAIKRNVETPDTMEFTNERSTSWEAFQKYREDVQKEMLKQGPER